MALIIFAFKIIYLLLNLFLEEMRQKQKNHFDLRPKEIEGILKMSKFFKFYNTHIPKYNFFYLNSLG